MSKTEIAVARVNATGALIRLHDGNRNLLKQPGVTESTATVDEKTKKLVEVNGADYTLMVSATKDLVRIGAALSANRVQRQTLLTAALKLAGAEKYLVTLGVYDGAEDAQYIDPDSLQSNSSGVENAQVNVVSQAEMKAMKEESQKPSRKKPKTTEKADADPVDLSDL